MSEPTPPVVRMMLDERYGPSSWWKTPPSDWNADMAVTAVRDDPLMQARRRRQLADAMDASDVAEESA